jgi:3-deoxy-manno-octulosonate cytidylyltransferase (CMP-KDO synthetase)
MTLCVIPACLDSKRFPNKVIQPICGRELISHVIDACITCDRIEQIVVLAQDQKICDLVNKTFDGVSRVSSQLHTVGESGTHRAFDYYYQWMKNKRNKRSMIVVQADNIGLRTNDLDTVIFNANSINNKSIYTPVCKMDMPDASLPSNVKAVIGDMGNILYFSRACIPYDAPSYYKHVGVYMFPSALLEDNLFMSYAMDGGFNNCDLVKYEQLEQLAWLHYGFSIRAVQLMGYRDNIDTTEDMVNYTKNYYATRPTF